MRKRASEPKKPVRMIRCEFCGRLFVTMSKKGTRKYCCFQHRRAAYMLRHFEKRFRRGDHAEWMVGFYQRLKEKQARLLEEAKKELANLIQK